MSICDFSEKTDVCKINHCIEEINGMESDSASPSDIWLIKFKNKVFYNDIEIKYGFLKIFLDIKTLPENLKSKSLYGLNYELKTYKEIIKPIVDYNICPNFIKYYSSGLHCTYDNLLKILESGYKDKNIKLILNRNINHIINGEDRLSITNNYIEKLNTDEINKDYRFNIILNQQVPKPFKKFYTWLRDVSDITLVWPVIFQIGVACYSMSLSKLVHNDLHSGNIFITELPSTQITIYYINNIKYTINTKFKVYLYDFDRSYVKRFGENELLTKEFIDGRSNYFIENLDIMKILCYVSRYFNISELISVKTDNKKLLNNIYDYDCFFTYFKANKIKYKKFFKNYYDTETILKNIASKLPDINYKGKYDKDNVYVCNKKNFNKDGEINTNLQIKS